MRRSIRDRPAIYRSRPASIRHIAFHEQSRRDFEGRLVGFILVCRVVPSLDPVTQGKIIYAIIAILVLLAISYVVLRAGGA